MLKVPLTLPRSPPSYECMPAFADAANLHLPPPHSGGPAPWRVVGVVDRLLCGIPVFVCLFSPFRPDFYPWLFFPPLTRYCLVLYSLPSRGESRKDTRPETLFDWLPNSVFDRVEIPSCPKHHFDFSLPYIVRCCGLATSLRLIRTTSFPGETGHWLGSDTRGFFFLPFSVAVSVPFGVDEILTLPCRSSFFCVTTSPEFYSPAAWSICSPSALVRSNLLLPTSLDVYLSPPSSQ